MADVGINPQILMRSAFIALGSNQPSIAGDPAATVRQALRLLEEYGLPVCAASRFYSTLAFPAESGPDFINAAVETRTSLQPDQILEILHEIESALGRERNDRWAARAVDLDLLAVDNVVLPDRDTHDHWRELAPQKQVTDAPDQLILPHPRLQDRAFVLVPLADIAPDWMHPILKLSVREMLNDLPDQDKQDVKPAE